MIKLSSEAKERLENAPEGRLRISKSRGSVQYYHCKPGLEESGIYIPTKERQLAEQLAQKGYDKKVVDYSEEIIADINRLLTVYSDDRIEQIYQEVHPERQKIINPVEPTAQMRIDQWMAKPFVGKEFQEGIRGYETNNGVRVRSKSEKILADYFESVGIPYKYECPLRLKGYGIVYPDFTFLSRRTWEEVYWEHEGMMDNAAYAQSAIQKIATYEMNGIFLGERLITTYETSSCSLNIELIKTLTQKYLL